MNRLISSKPETFPCLSKKWPIEKEINTNNIFGGIMTIYDEIWLLKYVVNER